MKPRSKPRSLSTGRSQAFCRALAEASRNRPAPWWVSIGDVAGRLRIPAEEAVELAIACEREGLVTHDLASFEGRAEKRARGRELMPHSVSLIGRGHDAASSGRPPRRRPG